VTTDANGQATVTVPSNDSLSRFRIVAIGSDGAAKFGEGTATFETTQALQVISGLPQQVRADDRLVQSITLRNTSTEEITVQLSAKAEILPAPRVALSADTRKARGLDFTQSLRLMAGENKVVSWPLSVPSQPGQLNWQFEARANLGNEALRDARNITQIVNEAIPITTRQATLVQIERETRLPFEQPSQALPQTGGVAITLQRSLADAALAETMDWMRRYPYTCLEQQTSRFSTLDDRSAWEQLMQKLPQYLSNNGLANYFPVTGMGSSASGSESLTAYVLDMAHAKGWSIPVAERTRMLDGLLVVQAGRAEPHDWAPSRYLLERQLSAQATLALYDHKRGEQQPVLPQDLGSLPSMALIDWIRFLMSPTALLPSSTDTTELAAQKTSLLAKASDEVRSRFDFQGTRLRWRNERSEYWWWFMWSGDSVAARAALLAQQLAAQSPVWRDDAPRIITGLIGRQGSGRWSTTVANAWAAQALRQFAAARESAPVTGVTRAALLSEPARPSALPDSVTHQWKDSHPQAERQSPELLLAWPQQGAQGQILLTHEGSGAPWATVAIKAAVRTIAPIANGLGIRRTVTAVERKTPNQWHVGDVIRVRLDMSSDANNTWVVVRDAIPSGATILGRGLGRESSLAQQGERSVGWAWPAFIERATESYRAYYRWVPQGSWSMEYTLRLNNSGEFQLPATRIEAMYAPEVFGEVPAAGLTVKP
jgi:alpha-2-macroglobulin